MTNQIPPHSVAAVGGGRRHHAAAEQEHGQPGEHAAGAAPRVRLVRVFAFNIRGWVGGAKGWKEGGE